MIAAVLSALSTSGPLAAPRQGVLITGGTGYLGHALVKKLLGDGCPRICIYSRNEYAQARMRAEFSDDKRLRWFIGDVRDQQRLERAMRSVYAVIHAAALKRIEVGAYDPEEMVKTNVYGTMNVIEAARRVDVGKVALVSSDKAYAPVSPYGQSKAMAEALVLNSNDPQFGPRFSVVRYGNVAGSTGSVIPTWRAASARGDGVSLTDPDCTRFWMDVEAASKLVVDTLVSMEGGELVVPDLPAYRLGDLAAAMGVSYMVRGLGAHEKKHETMEDGKCSADARRMTVEELKEALTRVA